MANVTTCTRCGALYEAGSEEQANEPRRLCRTCTLEATFKMTPLRKAVVELLTYYPADDVLAEIREVLRDERIPLPQTDSDRRFRLGLNLENDNC